MALHVGLVEHVQAVLVAQIEEGGIVRVVSGAHGVDVVLLHQLYIAAQVFEVERLARHFVVIVAVDPGHHDLGPVHPQAPVPHLHAGETDPEGGGFDHLVAAVEELDGQPVTIRVLGRPRSGATDVETEVGTRTAVRVSQQQPTQPRALGDHIDRLLGGRHHPSVRRSQGEPDTGALPHRASDRGPHLQRTRSGRRFVVTAGGHVPQVAGRSGVQEHAAMQPGMEPVVLIFDPRGVGPPDHHDRQGVVTRRHVRGEIELRGQTAVLAHADERAVAPHEGHTLEPTQREHGAPPGPPPGRRNDRR